MSISPLSGVRVIELATVIMGPYAGQQLGDLGADVIKVEGDNGDPIRWFPPQRHPGMSGISLTLNRNKRSVNLDLKSAEGIGALRALIRDADVFLTTLRPAALARLGLSPAELQADNPNLIYAQAAGFRSDSDKANAAAYDDLVQAASGLVWLNEQVTGEPNYLPTILADKVCGLMLAQGVLAAVIERQRTGHASHVEVPMVDTMLTFNLLEHCVGAVFEPAEEPQYGYSRVLSGSRRACPTLDGSMCVLPYSDRNWRDFFAFAGRSELADDPRFVTIMGRIENADALYRLLGELTAKFTTDELQEYCDSRSIPAYPVQDLAGAVESDYVQSVGLIHREEHPSEGAYRRIGPATRFDGASLPSRRHSPQLGEHNREVLGALADAVSKEQ